MDRVLLREVVVRFDNLRRMPFPCVMSLHQAPTDGADRGYHHVHVQFQPPNLLKYLAGPEVGAGGFMNDTSSEEKAAELPAVSPVHYSTHETTTSHRSEVAR